METLEYYSNSHTFILCNCSLVNACCFCRDWYFIFTLISCRSISALRSSTYRTLLTIITMKITTLAGTWITSLTKCFLTNWCWFCKYCFSTNSSWKHALLSLTWDKSECSAVAAEAQSVKYNGFFIGYQNKVTFHIFQCCCGIVLSSGIRTNSLQITVHQFNPFPECYQKTK